MGSGQEDGKLLRKQDEWVLSLWECEEGKVKVKERENIGEVEKFTRGRSYGGLEASAMIRQIRQECSVHKRRNEEVNPPARLVTAATEAILQQYRFRKWFFILVSLTGWVIKVVRYQLNIYIVSWKHSCCKRGHIRFEEVAGTQIVRIGACLWHLLLG